MSLTKLVSMWMCIPSVITYGISDNFYIQLKLIRFLNVKPIQQ